MKLVGTKEEIVRFLDALSYQTFHFPGGCDKIPDGFIGKYRGIDIEIKIEEKKLYVGMIESGKNNFTNLYNISLRHRKLTGRNGLYMCGDGTTIKCFSSPEYLRGFKLDELWMDTLPSDWDEFDLCMCSVGGDRNKIHFFKELEG